ncbi:hypothetical protein E1B28_011573 [Marasmius oreades]|uniref:Uncharacterized protein n=1 Tax=Marasmius oreades TaxID=181124 RepID=A0A9P7UQD3_9AGAR|nr:uncharacterized protein E1B28_011573 [Marasmius oreades]KAG7089945.1 hypothetical protein E1B28_011573 [Marasmius oreades]
MAETVSGDPDVNRGSTGASATWNRLRRKRCSNLTINVQSAMGWRPQSQAFQERTNSVGFSPYPPVRSSSYTPDPTYTFGVPTQTNFSDTGVTTPATGSGSASYTDFSGPRILHQSAGSSPPSSHIRTTLQPYSVPSSFSNPRSPQMPRTSVSSRAMSHSFSLTPTVAESDYQSVAVSLPHIPISHLRSNSSKFPSGVPSNSPFRSSSIPKYNSKQTQLPPLTAFLPPPNLPRSHHIHDDMSVPMTTTTTMSKRQRRYTLAEASLSTSLSQLLLLQTRLHSPTYIRQREIGGLKKAIAAVDERINEERVLLEPLKEMMKEGNEVDLDEYRERRNERWRIGKRLEALEGGRKRLEERLKVLSSSISVDPKVCEPSQAHSQAIEKSRMDRNLRRFLSETTSTTRAAFPAGAGHQGNHYRRHSDCRHGQPFVPVVTAGTRPRRMTMNNVEPMKLRRLSVEETFVEAMKGFAKGVAVLGVRPVTSRKCEVELEGEGEKPISARECESFRRSTLTDGMAPLLTSVVEDEDEGVVMGAGVSELGRHSDIERGRNLDLDELSSSTSSISDMDDGADDSDDPPTSPDTGTALIFRHHLLPPEISMDDPNIEFEIPTYARDLFNRFDKERGEVDVGFSLTLASASSPNLTASALAAHEKTPRVLRRFGKGLGDRHSSPSKQIGHGILMPRPSLVLDVPRGQLAEKSSVESQKSMSPKTQSRPVSTIDSLTSRAPGGRSRVSFVESNLESGGVDKLPVSESGLPVGRRLRRKLSKRIFGRW